jgi:DNA-binding response OmpR family regulator
MSKEKILVVDDEEDILELVRYNLDREGYKVTCATSGEEALKASVVRADRSDRPGSDASGDRRP